MKTNIPVTFVWLFAVFLLCALYAPANGQDCTRASPCEMTLHAMPGENDIHLGYGDTLTLRFDGNRTVLIPNAADWEGEGEGRDIQLRLVEVWKPGALPGTGSIVLAWEFNVKSKKDGHEPADKQHSKVHLYKNPNTASNDWVVDNAVHSDNSVHGGTAHMRQ